MSARRPAMPADFAAVAATMPMKALLVRFKCGATVLHAWLGAQPAAWQEARRKHLNRGKANTYDLGPPADLVERYVAASSLPPLAAECRVTLQTLMRWLQSVPAEIRAERTARIKQARRDAGAARRAANPKPPTRRKSKPAGSIFAGITPTAGSSLAAQAALHLARIRYSNVYDAGKVHGKDHAGFYVVGRQKMPTAAMIDLAKAKGFDPDAWRRIA